MNAKRKRKEIEEKITQVRQVRKRESKQKFTRRRSLTKVGGAMSKKKSSKAIYTAKNK